jgi:adenosylcobinamide-GDP ribazoletransferase
MTAPLARDDLRVSEPSTEADDVRRPRDGVPILGGIRAAFAFFTRIPVGGFPYGDRELAWAPAHAPLVGGVLGGALGALNTALLPLGTFPAATLVVGVSMLLTGALHEDGLADTSDALGGGKDRISILAILKDSRVGSFGAAAIAVSVLVRAALLGQLAHACMWALPLAWCAARVGPVWLMVFLPYVTPAQSAKSGRIVHPQWRLALVASAWFLAGAAIAIGGGWVTLPRAGLTAAAVVAITAITGLRYHRRLGGITGDFLGATEQLGEMAALAVLAWPS